MSQKHLIQKKKQRKTKEENENLDKTPQKIDTTSKDDEPGPMTVSKRKMILFWLTYLPSYKRLPTIPSMTYKSKL